MRIEVQVGSEEPVVYSLKEPKLIVGSGEAAHILVSSSVGVSRKHVQITMEGDKVFVTDMGSTNGSFINEERLVPGTRMEFTSFFPVRLGDNVYLTLLGDDEPGAFSSSLQEPIQRSQAKKETSAPKSISIGDLSKSSTKTKTKVTVKETSGTNKPYSAKANKKVATKEVSDSSRMKITFVMIVALVGMAVAYNLFISPPEPSPEEIAQLNPPPVAPIVATRPVAPPTPISLEASEIPKLEELEMITRDIKCATTLEKKICQLIPEASSEINGVVESIDKIVIILPEDKWGNESLKHFPLNGQHRFKLDQVERTKIVALFLFKSLPAFAWKEVGKNIFFVLYQKVDGTTKLSTVIGIKPESLDSLITQLPEKFTNNLYKKGKNLLSTFDKSLTVVNQTIFEEMAKKAAAAAASASTPTTPAPTTPDPIPPPAPASAVK